MTYLISISQQAEEAIAEAAQWYEEQSAGLGTTFLNAIDKSLLYISSNPLLYGYRKKNVRGYSMRKFPYKIMYLVSGNQIFIISVLHSSLKRNY
jgi:plasmid stabilization system protein ParE